jgi:hypothetical protein
MSRDNKAIVKEINEESHPSAGGHLCPGKPDTETDALGESLKASYKEQTEFEAKEMPAGAVAKARDKQTKDKAGCDETMRTPCNTGCSHK